MRLFACPACSQHVRAETSVCPHCGVAVRTTWGWRPPAMLLGLALTACPADDYHDDLPPEESSTSAPSTMTGASASASASASAGSDESSGSSTTDPASTGSESSSQGTTTDSGSSTGVDTTSTTDGSTTEGGSTTGGDEPLYGALDSA